MALREERGIWEIPLAEMSVGQERWIWTPNNAENEEAAEECRELQEGAVNGRE